MGPSKLEYQCRKEERVWLVGSVAAIDLVVYGGLLDYISYY